MVILNRPAEKNHCCHTSLTTRSESSQSWLITLLSPHQSHMQVWFGRRAPRALCVSNPHNTTRSPFTISTSPLYFFSSLPFFTHYAHIALTGHPASRRRGRDRAWRDWSSAGLLRLATTSSSSSRHWPASPDPPPPPPTTGKSVWFLHIAEQHRALPSWCLHWTAAFHDIFKR